MFKIKVKQGSKWKWLKGSVKQIELVDDIEQASYFSEGHTKWFLSLYYDRRDDIDYEVYM